MTAVADDRFSGPLGEGRGSGRPLYTLPDITGDSSLLEAINVLAEQRRRLSTDAYEQLTEQVVSGAVAHFDTTFASRHLRSLWGQGRMPSAVESVIAGIIRQRIRDYATRWPNITDEPAKAISYFIARDAAERIVSLHPGRRIHALLSGAWAKELKSLAPAKPLTQEELSHLVAFAIIQTGDPNAPGEASVFEVLALELRDSYRRHTTGS